MLRELAAGKYLINISLPLFAAVKPVLQKEKCLCVL